MILVVDPDSGFRSRISAEFGPGALNEVASLQELEKTAGLAGGGLSVVILGPNLNAQQALTTTDGLQLNAHDVSLLLIASTVTPELLRAALRSGVRDVLPATFSGADLREAVGRAEDIARQSRKVSAPPDDHKGPRRLVTVFSPKGGCGKSVVASNLAILMAQRTGGDIGLVDLDLGSGDLSIMLGLLPAWTIADAAEQLDRLDSEALAGHLTPHSSRVQLLAAPLDPAVAESVSAEAIRHILQVLGDLLPYVIIDAPCTFSDQVLAALDQSDLCILVGSMDVPSIRNLKLALGTLAQLGFPRDRVRLVLSRADSRVGLNLSEVEKTLGTKIDVAIPSSRDVPISVNQGVPLATQGRKSAVVSAIAGLVDAVLTPTDLAKTSRRGTKGRG